MTTDTERAINEARTVAVTPIVQATEIPMSISNHNPLDAINEAALAGPATARKDGTWVDLRRKGESTTGRFLSIDVRQRKWNGQTVTKRQTGEPRVEWVITFTDGTATWKVVANESMQSAITAAIRSLGQHLKVGDVMTIEVTADAPEKAQARYVAKILPAQ